MTLSWSDKYTRSHLQKRNVQKLCALSLQVYKFGVGGGGEGGDQC